MLEFRTIETESSWNEFTLKAVFRKGLNENICTKMACLDDEASLDSLIDLAIQLDNLLRDRGLVLLPCLSQPELPPPPEVMQLGRLCVSPEVKERRCHERQCYYCGESGHRIVLCPERDDCRRWPSTTSEPTAVSSSPSFPLPLLYYIIPLYYYYEDHGFRPWIQTSSVAALFGLRIRWEFHVP